MRVGVVGVGVAGSSHLFDLASSDRFTIAAVCARRPGQVAVAADMYGASQTYDNPATMIASARLDAVVIATPPHVSPSVAAMSLAAGLPTLIDKPAARTAAELEQVRSNAGTTAALAVIGYNRRYQHHVHHARQLLQSGSIGRITHVDCRWVGPFTRRFASDETYRIRTGRGDGVLLDTASHIIDTLLYLGIAPLKVTRARLGYGPTGADVAAHIELRWSSHEQPVSMRIDDSDDDDWDITVRGTQGKLCLDRTILAGIDPSGVITVAAHDLRRPVDDLVDLSVGRPTLGASLAEAGSVLMVIDQVRSMAMRQRPWLRPRAKALGRLNGAC